jgi:hypothetical protein
LLKKFLLRADELASYGPRAQRGSFSKAEKPQPKAVRPGR